MTDVFSPLVTWQAVRMDFWTKIYLTITTPNPSSTSVKIDWTLQGGAYPNPNRGPFVSQYCGWIEGYRTPSGDYSDHKESAIDYGKKWWIKLADGLNIPGDSDWGTWYVMACCRVEAFSDEDDFIKVKMHNYMELWTSNFITPLHHTIMGYSDSQIVHPKVRKI